MKFRKRLICLLALLTTWVGWVSVSASECMPYSDDPGHLWNLLHRAMWIRTDPNGVQYGCDRIDPLLWESTRSELREEKRDELHDLLTKLVDDRQLLDTMSPLAHVVLQHDLLEYFDWVVGPHNNESVNPQELKAFRRDLLEPLARAVDALALPQEDILNLPDTYSFTAENRNSASEGESGYFPEHLFEPGAPWISIALLDGPIALRHSQVHPTSVFLIFMSTPGGRDAGLSLLRDLNRHAAAGTSPEFPPYTRFALVRQWLSVSDDHRVVATPLTVEIQATAVLSGEIEKRNNERPAIRSDYLSQFQMFQILRSGLLKGQPVLHPVGRDHQDFMNGIFFMKADPFEQEGNVGAQSYTAAPITQCNMCHGATRLGLFMHNSRAPLLTEITHEMAVNRAVEGYTSSGVWQELVGIFTQPRLPSGQAR